MRALTIFLCFLLLLKIRAQTLTLGSCPKTRIINDFNITQYLGRWYEIAKYPNIFEHGDCSEKNYYFVGDYSQIVVIDKEVVEGEIKGVRGYLRILQYRSGHMKQILKSPWVGNRETDYDVLGTDYRNWALIYSCKVVFNNYRLEYAWILSRHRQLSPYLQALVEDEVDKNALDRELFQYTNHIGCADLETLPFTYYL